MTTTIETYEGHDPDGYAVTVSLCYETRNGHPCYFVTSTDDQRTLYTSNPYPTEKEARPQFRYQKRKYPVREGIKPTSTQQIIPAFDADAHSRMLNVAICTATHNLKALVAAQPDQCINLYDVSPDSTNDDAETFFYEMPSVYSWDKRTNIEDSITFMRVLAVRVKDGELEYDAIESNYANIAWDDEAQQYLPEPESLKQIDETCFDLSGIPAIADAVATHIHIRSNQ